MSKSHRRGAAAIWRWPALFAALICFGLTSALLGEGGAWWALSWIALALPLVVIVICIHRRRRPI